MVTSDDDDFRPFAHLCQEHKSKLKNKADLVDMDLTVYYSDNCGYCQRLKTMLQPYRKHITMKNVADPEVRKEIQENHPHCTGWPYITSGKYNSWLLGAASSVSALTDYLIKHKDNQNDPVKPRQPAASAPTVAASAPTSTVTGPTGPTTSSS